MTCQHNVAVGAWCRYCGTAVDSDLVRAYSVPPRDPDIELYEDAVRVVMCDGCALLTKQGPGVVSAHVAIRAGRWSVCPCCGTQAKVMR